MPHASDHLQWGAVLAVYKDYKSCRSHVSFVNAYLSLAEEQDVYNFTLVRRSNTNKIFVFSPACENWSFVVLSIPIQEEKYMQYAKNDY